MRPQLCCSDHDHCSSTSKRSLPSPTSTGSTPSIRSTSVATTAKANSGHGLLLVNNDDIVAAGGGFGTHGHRDMEIVTWVLSASSSTTTARATTACSTPGLAQRMSAGSGIRHSEMNAERHRARPLRADVGAARHRRRRSRLRAARHQRRAGQAAGWCRSRRARATTARSASISETPCCGVAASLPATTVDLPTTSTSTSSSPSATARQRRHGAGHRRRCTHHRQAVRFTAGPEGADCWCGRPPDLVTRPAEYRSRIDQLELSGCGEDRLRVVARE